MNAFEIIDEKYKVTWEIRGREIQEKEFDYRAEAIYFILTLDPSQFKPKLYKKTLIQTSWEPITE